MSDQEQSIESLKKDLADRNLEIQLLKEIGAAVNSELQLQLVLDLVAEKARRLINADTVLIPLLNADCSEYTYRAGCGKNTDEILGESLPIELGICGWIWKHKRAWWRGVLSELSDEERNRWEKQAGTMMMAPLIGKRSFLGGIAGIDKTNGKDFTRRDFDLLVLFANQVSIAIENAATYEKLKIAKMRAEEYQSELRELNSKLGDANDALEQLALYDPLTGLPNRSLIKDRIAQAALRSKSTSIPMSVLMIDMDHFKEINDTLGHNEGDELLKNVCTRFQEVLDEKSILGRLGGDEFCIIVQDDSSTEAMRICEKLMRQLEDSFELSTAPISISASIGIAVYPEHGTNAAELLQKAEIAMYSAKRSRCRYFVYDPAEDKHSMERLSLINSMRTDLNANLFELYYQPKIEIDTSRIVGFEALARRSPPDSSENRPDFFIPILEETSLIQAFTGWVLNAALEQCAAWRKINQDFSISVNLSAHNLREADFPDTVLRSLEKHQVPPESLVLEITESAVMADNKLIRHALRRLSQRGIQFSIDDFGTGYSSLTHLKKLEVSELKIDKSFVSGMLTDGDDKIIVRSIIDLGHNLGLRIVAEGVEKEELISRLIDMKCEICQGYLFSKPLPAAKVQEFIENDRYKYATLT